MMVYRSLVLGLLGAIALLVAAPPQVVQPATAVPVAVAEAADRPQAFAVVDVSRRAAGPFADVMPLLGLEPGERIVGIGDLPATSVDLPVRWRDTTAESYLDIQVRGPAGDRRILVLAHP